MYSSTCCMCDDEIPYCTFHLLWTLMRLCMSVVYGWSRSLLLNPTAKKGCKSPRSDGNNRIKKRHRCVHVRVIRSPVPQCNDDARKSCSLHGALFRHLDHVSKRPHASGSANRGRRVFDVNVPTAAVECAVVGLVAPMIWDFL
jgi:hypothetical protein